jgi:hypothetical protein
MRAVGQSNFCCARHLSDSRPPLHWSPVPSLTIVVVALLVVGPEPPWFLCRFSSVHLRSLRFWPLLPSLSLRSFPLFWLWPISSFRSHRCSFISQPSFSDLGCRCFVISIMSFDHSCFCPNEEHLVSRSFLGSLMLYIMFSSFLVIGHESLHLYARTFGAA